MDLNIPRLGQAKITSPLRLSTQRGDSVANYVQDSARILYDISVDASCSAEESRGTSPLSFEKAGPREKIYFDPSKLHVGIVTCGGLCPGINTVIRTLVIELSDRYYVQRITGFRYGFAGLEPSHGYPVLELDPDRVLLRPGLGGDFSSKYRTLPVQEAGFRLRLRRFGNFGR